MDWIFKGLLTAAVVGVVLFAARGWSRCAAGWLAGLPMTTVPMLAWLSADHGAGFAADAAVAGVAVCGPLALLALAVAWALADQRRAAVVAGLGAVASGLLLPWLAVHGGLPGAVAAALVGCALALRQWPRPAVRLRPSAGSWRSALVTAAVAGLLSVGASAAGPALGMATAGWLASLPIVTASVAMAEASAGGRAAVAPFLHGYVLGLIGRIAFGAAFVLGLDHLPCATALALACAVAVAGQGLIAGAGLAGSRTLRLLSACRPFAPPISIPTDLR